MLREDANPIEMAVALLDDTSVGLAIDYKIQHVEESSNKLYVVW